MTLRAQDWRYAVSRCPTFSMCSHGLIRGRFMLKMPYFLCAMIRCLSVVRLRDFLSRHYAVLYDSVDWSGDCVVQDVVAEAQNLSASDLTLISRDAELICRIGVHMDAFPVWVDCPSATVIAFDNSIDRSCWIFCHEPDLFSRATNLYFSCPDRCSQCWGRYLISHGQILDDSNDAVAEFSRKINAIFSVFGDVQMDFFEYSLDESADGGSVFRVVFRQNISQISCLNCSYPDSVSAGGRAFSCSCNSVVYVSGSGFVDVLSDSNDARDLIARAFIDSFFCRDVTIEDLPVYQFDLGCLLTDSPLSVDASVGIESAYVSSMRLQEISGEFCFQIDVASHSRHCPHGRIVDWFRCHPWLSLDQFVLFSATIILRFHSVPGCEFQRLLPVTVARPNLCNLSGLLSTEQIIGEQCLRNWGVIRT